MDDSEMCSRVFLGSAGQEWPSDVGPLWGLPRERRTALSKVTVLPGGIHTHGPLAWGSEGLSFLPFEGTSRVLCVGLAEAFLGTEYRSILSLSDSAFFLSPSAGFDPGSSLIKVQHAHFRLLPRAPNL